MFTLSHNKAILIAKCIIYWNGFDFTFNPNLMIYKKKLSTWSFFYYFTITAYIAWILNLEVSIGITHMCLRATYKCIIHSKHSYVHTHRHLCAVGLCYCLRPCIRSDLEEKPYTKWLLAFWCYARSCSKVQRLEHRNG